MQTNFCAKSLSKLSIASALHLKPAPERYWSMQIAFSRVWKLTSRISAKGEIGSLSLSLHIPQDIFWHLVLWLGMRLLVFKLKLQASDWKLIYCVLLELNKNRIRAVTKWIVGNGYYHQLE